MRFGVLTGITHSTEEPQLRNEFLLEALEEAFDDTRSCSRIARLLPLVLREESVASSRLSKPITARRIERNSRSIKILANTETRSKRVDTTCGRLVAEIGVPHTSKLALSSRSDIPR